MKTKIIFATAVLVWCHEIFLLLITEAFSLGLFRFMCATIVITLNIAFFLYRRWSGRDKCNHRFDYFRTLDLNDNPPCKNCGKSLGKVLSEEKATCVLEYGVMPRQNPVK